MYKYLLLDILQKTDGFWGVIRYKFKALIEHFKNSWFSLQSFLQSIVLINFAIYFFFTDNVIEDDPTEQDDQTDSTTTKNTNERTTDQNYILEVSATRTSSAGNRRSIVSLVSSIASSFYLKHLSPACMGLNLYPDIDVRQIYRESFEKIMFLYFKLKEPETLF